MNRFLKLVFIFTRVKYQTIYYLLYFIKLKLFVVLTNGGGIDANLSLK
jgi:hypothetical protein